MTKVTLTLTPAQFDCLRRAVDEYEANLQYIVKDTSTDPKTRQEARQEAVLTQDLKRALS